MIISEKGPESSSKIFSRSTPFVGKIASRRLLSGKDSSRKTYHIELDIQGSSITYRPGDSVGIIPENDSKVVDEIISLLQAPLEVKISLGKDSSEDITLYQFLKTKANLTRISSSLLKLLAQSVADETMKRKLINLCQKENKEELAAFTAQHDVVDLLRLAPFRLDIDLFCKELSPLLPRFYSISSSQKKYSAQIHLTVALASFQKNGSERFGVATYFLCQLAQEQTTPIRLYVQPSQHFTLPDDLSQDIVMIGPGTGVAPFISFLQERDHLGATGRHWLFFGERNRVSDFYYEPYLLDLQGRGKLLVDAAFSRDGDEKVYVQHKMLQSSAELWRWIQGGATVYICGDAEKMAKDVEKTLITIALKEGSMSEELARSYVKSMRSSKKLLLDVY